MKMSDAEKLKKIAEIIQNIRKGKIDGDDYDNMYYGLGQIEDVVNK